MTVTAGSPAFQPGPRVPPGSQLGDYRVGAPLWPLRIADAYRADGPAGPATLLVVHAHVAQHPAVREQVVAGTRTAAALPEHRHLVRTLAAGLTGDILWIATEELDGSTVRELLTKKRQTGAAGLGARAAGNLVTGIAAALADVHHGALATESVVVSRSGRVRVLDLALGPGTLAASVAGLIPASSGVAPECAAGAPPSAPGDVYAIGALLYEALVGRPLERGGPRPSDVLAGVNTQIDEVVARACHREAGKRFGRVEVLGEVVAEALQKGGALQTSALASLAASPTLGDQASLASELGGAGAGAEAPDRGDRGDRALAAALADTTEKWIINRDRMDYGPFSLADVLAQIERGEIVAGNIIQDKDTGARRDVGDDPLLGPLVDASRMRRDDARRAQAEVKAQSRDKTRGALLYGLIGVGVLGAAAGVYLVVRNAQGDQGATATVASVSTLDGASLKVKVGEPKKPPPAPRRPQGKRPAGAAPSAAGDTLSFDMGDENDETETLALSAVYGVYSRHGARLGGCLQASGERAAHISMTIDGPSGRVTAVKVNDKQAGGLHGCLAGVLRSMQFPSVRGPRTRAEFDLAM